MPITHRLQHGELCAFDPGDSRGPWTFELPQSPSNGDYVTLKALTFDHTEVIIDSISELIYDPELVTAVPAVKLNFVGSALELRYNTAVGGWLSYYSQDPLTQFAALAGTPNNLNPGTSVSDIVGWDNVFQTALWNIAANPPNGTTGEITLPVDGIYRITFLIMHQQANDNKELSIVYWFRQQSTDEAVAVFDVATDKTDIRNGSGSFLIQGAAGDVCKMGMSREGSSIGNSPFLPSTFQIEFVDVNVIEDSA